MARLAPVSPSSPALLSQMTAARTERRLQRIALGITATELLIASLWAWGCAWGLLEVGGLTSATIERLNDVLSASLTLQRLRVYAAIALGVLTLAVVQAEVRLALLPAIARWTRTEPAIWQFLLKRTDRLPVQLEDAAKAFITGKASPEGLVRVTLEAWASATTDGTVYRYTSLPKLIGRLAPKTGSTVPPLIRFALAARDKEAREAAIRWVGSQGTPTAPAPRSAWLLSSPE